MQGHDKRHPRMLSKFAVVCLTFLIAAPACREMLGEGKDAPFSAKLGELTFDVPKRDDLYQAHQLEEGLISIRVCDRERFYEKYERPCRPVRGWRTPW